MNVAALIISIFAIVIALGSAVTSWLVKRANEKRDETDLRLEVDWQFDSKLPAASYGDAMALQSVIAGSEQIRVKVTCIGNGRASDVRLFARPTATGGLPPQEVGVLGGVTPEVPREYLFPPRSAGTVIEATWQDALGRPGQCFCIVPVIGDPAAASDDSHPDDVAARLNA